jgi:signal transduction histidine kinase
VLVVDDDESVLLTISAILEREGYEIEAVADTAEALARLHAERFDVVLTDLRLDGGDGLALLGDVRRWWPDTTPLVLTGYASLQSAIEALREGAYDYLIKPCDVEELKATVARAVERGALSRALRQRIEELDAANVKLARFNEELSDRVTVATAGLNQKVIELAEAKRRLEAEQSQRANFIGMIAHDLGQPLTAIKGFAQLLGRPTLSDDARQRARLNLLEQTQRLIRLVRDLSDAALLATGSFQIAPADGDLVQLLASQVELARMTAPERAIELDAPTEPIPVYADRDRLGQVISNLLSNALKYAPTGPVHAAVQIDAASAVLTIRDHGPGIPPDRLADIFGAYVRLGAAGRDAPSGSGLGLYIAKGIVEAHGGRIWAECPGPNRGATFNVALPLAPSGPADVSRGAAEVSLTESRH